MSWFRIILKFLLYIAAFVIGIVGFVVIVFGAMALLERIARYNIILASVIIAVFVCVGSYCASFKSHTRKPIFFYSGLVLSIIGVGFAVTTYFNL